MANEASANRIGQSRDYNFLAFSRDEAYREANRDLLSRALSCLPSPFFQVDVASGTGLVAQEMSSLSQEKGKRGTIIGIDTDRFAVESARRLAPSTPNCTVEFVEGRAQDMEQLLAGRIPPAGVDYVSIHDAIHEIEGERDKRSVFQCMARILKPGGLFTYNSAFTTAAMEQSAMLWGKWKARAFSILGGSRNRKVKGLTVHTPEEYRRMIVNAGLSVIHEAKKGVKLPRTALEAIARYPRFIYGVFADLVGEEKVLLEEKSQALIEALDSLDITEAQRVWHELVARKLPSTEEAHPHSP
jgi:ubiquinone/menaquinone biosynthesis C-methylase UbiE